ncbi:MAG: penicillin-binding transpeptidase domain-containing protein [Phycisphaeraceae bacterium]
MFHRRLALLVIFASLVALAVGAQAARMSAGQAGVHRLAEAERALRNTELIPTIRGRILDRHGRELAVDAPAYDVAVSYRVLSGQWAYDRALAAAARAHRDRWGELSQEEREDLIAAHREPYEEQRRQLWARLAELAGVAPVELTERADRIVARVHREANYLWAYWHARRQAELDQPVPFAETVQPTVAQRQAHSVLDDVSPDVRAAVRRHITDADRDDELAIWDEVELRRPRHRRYPHESITVTLDRSTLPEPLRSEEPIDITVDGVGIHLIGMMRPAWREDIEPRPLRTHGPDRDLAGYRDGDHVGRTGIERAYEQTLRGRRGQVVQHLDTGREQRIEPVAGRDVTLTIDIQLQARVQAILDPAFGVMRVQPWHDPPGPDEDTTKPRLGEPLYGGAVVLDVETGDILAAATAPGYSRQQHLDDPASVWRDAERMPHLNRALSRPYDPGSTLKAMTLAAASREQLVRLDETINCVGHYYPDRPNELRCWIHSYNVGGHGSLAGAEALARSCNIYFYELGNRLGPHRTTAWLEAFGLGRRSGIGLAEETPGHVPASDDLGRTDPIMLAIGQGPVSWTPLQGATAYAALARGGELLSPRLALPSDPPPSDEGSGEGDVRKPAHLGLDPATLDVIMQGLDDAVNASIGSAHSISLPDGRGRQPIFNVPGAHVLGKSGTAQTAPTRRPTSDDGIPRAGDPVIRSGNHAWFIGLLQPDGEPRPRYVVAVVVEHGDSGGRTAAPVANQIMHAIMEMRNSEFKIQNSETGNASSLSSEF